MPDHDFAKSLSTALANMYDQAAGAESGLLRPVPVARGRELMTGLGYPEALVARIPAAYLDCAFPCASPLAIIEELAPARLVDLGCGIGLDLLFAALSLPEIQELHGFDGSSELRRKGSEMLASFPAAAGRISLDHGDLNRPDQLDLPMADLVLMNGSFNLVCDKQTFLKTIAGRLAPGGRLLLCDFLLSEPLPAGFRDELDNWLWNIGGALSYDELATTAAAAGLAIHRCRELERIAPVIRAEIILAKK